MDSKTCRLQISLVSLIFLLFLLESCSCTPKTSIDNSNPNLNIKYTPKNSFLLSTQLSGKKFQDIFTNKEIQELNLKPQDPIFLEQDNEKNIYQIKVLHQKGVSCGYHSIKNYLWLMKALSSDFNKFNEYYFSILSGKTYETYQESTGCPSHGSIADYQKIVFEKIKNKQIKSVPEESAEYIASFTPLNFSKYKGMYDIQEIEKEAKPILSSIEGLNQDSANKFAYEIAILDSNKSTIEKLYSLSLDFNNNSSFLHGFDLNVYTSMDHALCLIINKDKENIEYILADSLNSNFKRAAGMRYLQAIDTLKSFISQKGYLEEVLVRYIYIMLSHHLNKTKYEKSRVFQRFLPELDKFRLKEAKLYKTIYRRHFIDLLNKYKDQCSNNDEAKVYDKLITEL